MFCSPDCLCRCTLSPDALVVPHNSNYRRIGLHSPFGRVEPPARRGFGEAGPDESAVYAPRARSTLPARSSRPSQGRVKSNNAEDMWYNERVGGECTPAKAIREQDMSRLRLNQQALTLGLQFSAKFRNCDSESHGEELKGVVFVAIKIAAFLQGLF